MPGSVEQAVRADVRPGKRLATLERKAPFTVGGYEHDGVELRLGDRQARTFVTWACLEGVPMFLVGRGWVPISGPFDSRTTAGTLDSYLKSQTSQATVGVVGALLEAARIVEIDRDRPIRVRLADTPAAQKASQPASPEPYLKQATRRMDEKVFRPFPR